MPRYFKEGKSGKRPQNMGALKGIFLNRAHTEPALDRESRLSAGGARACDRDSKDHAKNNKKGPPRAKLRNAL